MKVEAKRRKEVTIKDHCGSRMQQTSGNLYFKCEHTIEEEVQLNW